MAVCSATWSLTKLWLQWLNDTRWYSKSFAKNVPKSCSSSHLSNNPCTSKRRIRRAHRVAGEPGALWKLKAISLPWLGMVGIPLIEMVVYGIGFATLYILNRAVTTAIVDGFNMFQASYTERLVLLPLDAGASSKKGASCHGGPKLLFLGPKWPIKNEFPYYGFSMVIIIPRKLASKKSHYGLYYIININFPMICHYQLYKRIWTSFP